MLLTKGRLYDRVIKYNGLVGIVTQHLGPKCDFNVLHLAPNPKVNNETAFLSLGTTFYATQANTILTTVARIQKASEQSSPSLEKWSREPHVEEKAREYDS